jgi:hypothetical protein
MKTLVIHPDDRSTDFLRPIYKNLPNVTLITGETTKQDVIKLIEHNDRVIMLGHGSPNGLFGINFNRDFVIDSTCVEALHKKKYNAVYIWCNADQFVSRYDLHGLHSGMFISEVIEAEYCGLDNITQEQVDDSNSYFANTCGLYLKEKFDTLACYVSTKHDYQQHAVYNPVAKYNSTRLYWR